MVLKALWRLILGFSYCGTRVVTINIKAKSTVDTDFYTNCGLFINKNNQYLGGAISPGIDIRYQSLHHYTSKLPKLIKSEAHNLIGTSTSEAIHSGVINGVIHEIEGVIRQYELDFHHLTIVLTGGDTKFLFKQLKNSIFANQNFLLNGLNKILTFNNQ